MAKIQYKKQPLPKTIKNLIKSAKLNIGFFESAKYDDGTQVAEVAFYNEFGTSRIPPRPFFRNAITKNKKKWFEVIEIALQKHNGDFKKAFAMLGEVAVGDIKQSITNLGTPPNAPSTIKAKKSSNPLINTGLLRNSVSYEVSNG